MKSRRVDMFGIKRVTLEESRSMVEKILGIKLEEHNSDHFDGVYFQCQIGTSGEVRLYSNFDVTKSEWIIGHSREHTVLLRVTCLPDMDDVQRRLLSFSDDIVLLGSSAIRKQQKKEPE